LDNDGATGARGLPNLVPWNIVVFGYKKKRNVGVKGAFPLVLIEQSSDCEIEKMRGIFAASPFGGERGSPS